MKLIIECTEQTYSECKKISGLSETAYVIAHGIPYNPPGDLISREALKKEFDKECQCDCSVCEHSRFDSFKGYYHCGLIDNAQAIPLPNEQIAWEQGYEAGLAQGKHDRPQGELRNVVHGLLAYKACNKCNAEYPFDLTEDWILCPVAVQRYRKAVRNERSTDK